MAASYAETKGIEGRSEPRDEVYHRARALDSDGRAVQVLIVNISAHGLMARCEVDYPVGQMLRIDLPGIGRVAAQIRWSLGGRIGVQIDPAIPLARYYGVLAAMG